MFHIKNWQRTIRKGNIIKILEMRSISFAIAIYTSILCFKFSMFILTHVKQMSGTSERCSNSNRKRAKTPKDPRAPTARDVIQSLEPFPKMGWWVQGLFSGSGGRIFMLICMIRLFCVCARGNWGRGDCRKKAVQWGKQIHDTGKWLSNHHFAFIHKQIFPKDMRN